VAPIRRSSFALALLVACGHATPSAPAPAPDRIAIVVVEASARGTRLVALDERGDRLLELIDLPGTAHELYPAISPDGRWLAFASGRDDPPGETSLWLAALRPAAHPRRLTSKGAIDTHPTWAPDSRSIIFASTRDASDYNLWRVSIDGGEPEQLTNLGGHETMPSAARDGTIYFASIVPRENGAIESRLMARRPDGSFDAITEGPADSSPAISPDGTTLVFSRPSPNGRDADLWRMAATRGSPAEPLVVLPQTDEGGPAWSRDGRYIFATSVFWSVGKDEQGADRPRAPLLSSVIAIDTRERPAVPRILADRAGTIARLQPAIAPLALDDRALHDDAEYSPALARMLEELVARRLEAERR
jgi:dipeptidyl aminopeptidase/acylaminoacyl peptidase